MKPRTAVAVSGGVDSFVTAFLLRQQGHDVIGIHFITGYEPGLETAKDLPVSAFDRHPHFLGLRDIGKALDIPIHFLDCRTEFQKNVVRYFTSAYMNGKTPNPCLRCNPQIKFRTVLNQARRLGATQLATGHYVRKTADSTGRFHLRKGVDAQKDQSYFLAFLSQDQLAKACFPLGEYTKTEVIGIAEKNGLKPVSSRESQDICFIHGRSYPEFLQENGCTFKPGSIVDTQGKTIGQHQGLHRYTIGQRRGINCPAPDPYYVIRLDMTRNRLVVGAKNDLYTAGCTVEDVHWINEPAELPFDGDVRIRYQHTAAPASIKPLDGRRLNIHFDSPQLSITPGQGAVIYNHDEVMGGGWIVEST